MCRESRAPFSVRAMSIAILLFGCIVGFTLSATEEGIWVESGTGGGCTGNSVCADWEVNGQAQMSCCIDPKYLGTGDEAACATAR